MSRKFNAILGLGALAAFGFASSAFAQCPTGPVPPWSAQDVGGGTSALSIVTPGDDGTSCRLQASVGDSGVARAQVRDDTPADEPSYRAQFLFDASAISGQGGFNQVQLHRANSATAVNGSLQLVGVTFNGSGGGTKRVTFIAACSNGGTGICTAQANIPDPAGANRVEYDLQVGAGGTFRYWIAAEGAPLDPNTPTGTITLTGGNLAWGGVDTAFVGLSSPSTAYRALNAGLNVWFDEFDSRRTSFIGN